MQLSFQKGSRSLILGGLLLVMMAIFVGRLFYLQIIMHEDYVAQAMAEQVKPLTIPAKRGLVYAMDGEKPIRLVMNQTVYTLFVDPATVNEPNKVLETVRRVAGGNLRPNIDKLIAKKDSRYQILGTKLSRQQAELIKKEELKGVGFQEVSQRVYPEGGLAAQTLGFVNAEGKGQYGIEEALDDRLVGHDGLLKSVTDVSGVPLTIGNQNINKPAKDGENIVLTIDRNVQAYAEKALAKGLEETKAQKGSVIVMDPQTGKVMAMANLPSYRPAEFTKVTDAYAFNNATVAIPYEAGSVIKTLTVAAGLDQGVIRPDSTYVNTDKIKVGDKEIGNATKGQTGTVTMQRALDYSLNTGMVTIAQRLGDGSTINQQARDTMYDYFYNRFGLGQRTGLELLGEARGDVTKPNAPGAAVQYATMSFGQGMNVTMTQVISAFCSSINGGTYYRPTVVAGTVDSNSTFSAKKPEVLRKGVVTEQTSATVRSMVYEARKKFHGGKDRAGYEVGGKTGTSQTIVNGRYVDEQTIGSYLGFGAGGDGAPRYVIMVQVSGDNMNLEGGKHAMPIFTDISNWMIDYLKLQPRV